MLMGVGSEHLSFRFVGFVSSISLYLWMVKPFFQKLNFRKMFAKFLKKCLRNFANVVFICPRPRGVFPKPVEREVSNPAFLIFFFR